MADTNHWDCISSGTFLMVIMGLIAQDNTGIIMISSVQGICVVYTFTNCSLKNLPYALACVWRQFTYSLKADVRRKHFSIVFCDGISSFVVLAFSVLYIIVIFCVSSCISCGIFSCSFDPYLVKGTWFPLLVHE